MNELALLAGAGGGILGGHLLGWKTVCAVEIDAYAASVLCCRQNDGVLPPFPIWDDVRSFDGRPWRGIVDVISGGFPCQDISAAGKGAGITGERSGLWKEFARVIGEVRPRFVIVENSPVLTSRGLGTVLGDLAALGYDADWGVLGAADAGAPHKRERIWIVANSLGLNCDSRRTEPAGQLRSAGVAHGGDDVADATGQCQREPADQANTISTGWSARNEPVNGSNAGHPNRQGLAQREGQPSNDGPEQPPSVGTDWWSTEPAVRGMVDGMATELDEFGTTPGQYLGRVASGVQARVDRLKAIGNGQVPATAALAWETLT